jgi:hypothetical protein
MGITLEKLQQLRDGGVLSNGCAVLDIGSSNLYSAEVANLQHFARGFGRELSADFAEKLSSGSAYGPRATKNESFVGELLEGVGLGYLAFDIADGYATKIFDLNREAIPKKLRGAFGTVLNFGTTEHVVSQLNCFRVIHDAVKVGGHIVHQLPTVGYIDHGYFCYTPRFFFDLAGYNKYEVIDFSYAGPGDRTDFSGILKDYVSYFPALTNCSPPEGHGVQDYSINIVLRKTMNAPLRLPMETSTSVVRTRQSPKRLVSRLFGRS